MPLVVRMATGAGRQLAAQHSHSLEPWYAHIPGIKVVAPATVEDAYGMLGPALAESAKRAISPRMGCPRFPNQPVLHSISHTASW